MSVPSVSSSISLDHGGMIYPYTARSKWNQVFRLEAELDEPIDIAVMNKALQRVKNRFPFMFVYLSKGKRCYELTQSPAVPEVVTEGELLCAPFDLKQQEGLLLRFTVLDNRLGLECFHAVADGFGASVLLKNILAEYFREKGVSVPSTYGILDDDAVFGNAHTADSFLDVFKQGGENVSRSESGAYQYNKGNATGNLRLTTFEFSAADIKKKSVDYSTSVTQILAALYTKALCKAALGEGSKKSVKVEIPLDLRRRFDSETLRNFSLYFMTAISPDCAELGIKEIIDMTKEQFNLGTDPAKLRNDIYTNVSQSEMALFRNLPIVLKSTLLKVGTAIYGERLFTSPLSNLGIFKLPDEIGSHVKNIGFIIGKTVKNTVYSSVVTFNGFVYWDVTSVVSEPIIETHIGNVLRDEGIDFVSRVRE